jgi:hypothetical protein
VIAHAKVLIPANTVKAVRLIEPRASLAWLETAEKVSADTDDEALEERTPVTRFRGSIEG